MEQKFYKCEICGQMVAMVKQTNSPLICCGQQMGQMIAGNSDASLDKHIPKYKVENNIVKVNVGSISHPMTAEHYIEWVSIQTKKGNQRKALTPNSEPYVEFLIAQDDCVEVVYAYCNLHGLWKA